jgi:hypothetical chaperone protein
LAMSDRPIGCGIDFGTSNSLISIAWPDRVHVVEVGSRRVLEALPSVIYLNADGNRAAGDVAIEQYLVSAGINSRLLVGIKSDLSDQRFEKTSSWGMSWTMPDLVEVILRAVKGAADSVAGESIERVVLGHPVAFVGTEGPNYERLQTLAMNRLMQAARQAGFVEIETYEEPAAAVQQEDLPTGIVVSLDFGGGTFDVAVVDYGLDEPEVIALRGAAVGGERFDQQLFNAKIATELGLHEEFVDLEGKVRRLPARVSGNSRGLLDLQGLLGDPNLPEIIKRFKGYRNGAKLDRFERLLFGGFAFQFYEAIEEAKIRLSTMSETSIAFHRPGLDIDIPITRNEFNALIEQDIALIEREIRLALSDADIEPSSVERVVQTGGSSAIPLFAEMVRSVFTHSDLQQRPAFTTVVQGLGLFAQELWR